MDTSQAIITIISTILGTGGITAILTSIFSAKKYKAEALRIEQDTEQERQESEQRMNDSIRQQIMELSEIHRKESDVLRKQNKILSDQIKDLNMKIQDLMEWIAYDNSKYRAWLETELVKLKSDIVFPECRPAPKFVNDAAKEELIDHRVNDVDMN